MIPSPLQVSDLLPADILLFARPGPFQDAQQIKFGWPVSHVEGYIGNGHTVASRDGIGVSCYTVDLEGIYSVLRPCCKFNLVAAMEDFTKNHNRRPYGFKSLAEFANLDLNDDGEFCSELICNWLRAGGMRPFSSRVSARVIAPAHYIFISDDVAELVYQAEFLAAA